MKRYNEYKRKITATPPRKLLAKALRKLKRMGFIKVEKYQLLLTGFGLSDEEFLGSFGYRFSSLGALLERLRHAESGKGQPKFFINSGERKKIVELFKKSFPKKTRGIIRDADKVCKHKFDLLGSGESDLSAKIDWHYDFKSACRWNPRTFYKEVKISPRNDSSDIKVPWELSRFQHLVTLGKAYWLTDDEKYAREFVDEISSWIANNPYKFGVNWACTMEVAIRAINWVWGYYFFRDSPYVNDTFLIRFLKSILQHGRYIYNNIETFRNGITTNHTLFDYGGLVCIGLMFPEFREAEDWLEKGISGLEEETEKQVYSDGVNFESSIPYHGLVVELLVSVVLLLKINGYELSTKALNRLERMFEYIMYYTRPDGLAPQFGDNDSGRLHILADYGNSDARDHRYLLSVGAVLFNRYDFKKIAGRFHEEAFWLLGERGQKKFHSIRESKVKIGSKAFKDGGIYIMRKGNNFMIINADKVGTRGIGTHKHNDILSFELCVGGMPCIVDPGTYVYSANPLWRNEFRSTKFHNTVVVDGEEQNRLSINSLFSIANDSVPKVLDWQSTNEYDLFDAEHNGYKCLDVPVKHRRQIYFDKCGLFWIIKDFLTGNGEHFFEWYYHFDSSIEPEMAGELTIKARIHRDTELILKPKGPKGLRREIFSGWISRSYGHKETAPVVRYFCRSSCPLVVQTVVRISGNGGNNTACKDATVCKPRINYQ